MHKDYGLLMYSPHPSTLSWHKFVPCWFFLFLTLSHSHTHGSHGHVWLSFLLSAIPHPWEINRGSGIGARANWALLSLFSYCCQERFVIAAPGSHHGAGGACPRSDKAFGCHREGSCVWLSDLVKSSTRRKGIAKKGFIYSHVGL